VLQRHDNYEIYRLAYQIIDHYFSDMDDDEDPNMDPNMAADLAEGQTTLDFDDSDPTHQIPSGGYQF
jgi:hypothetical protein